MQKINEWARVYSELQKVRRAKLKEFGYTNIAFRHLEDEAIQEFSDLDLKDTVIETPSGRVQAIVKSSFLHAPNSGKVTAMAGTKVYLHLAPLEE